MSLSSATTLISTTPVVHHHPRPHPAAHSHSHTAMKRRASSHTAHTHASTARRGSEGEGGRRAVVAGLTMHAMTNGPKPPRRKSTVDRPLPKSSRSETHLPHLSRTTSTTSATSHTSNVSQPGRKRSLPPSRNHSEESVTVLDADGHPIISPEDEGWESGDGGEEVQKETSNQSGQKGKTTKADADQSGRPSIKGNGNNEGEAPIRRAISDTAATSNPKSKSNILSEPLIDSPLDLPQPSSDSNIDHYTKTTGFSGPVQTPDPIAAAVAAQNPIDQDHVRPAHVIQHRLSTANLLDQNKSDPNSGESSLVVVDSTSRLETAVKSGRGHQEQVSSESGKIDDAEARTVNGHNGSSQQTRKASGISENTVAGSSRAPMRSTSGSGLNKETVSDSPRYPFPVLPPTEVKQESPPVQVKSHREAQGSNTDRQSPSTGRQRQSPHTHAQPQSQTQTQSQSESQPQSQSRPPQGQIPHQTQSLRHRPSHSSLRSIQSLRAPPHPLNSPTGRRTGTYSALNSPSKSGSMVGGNGFDLDNQRKRVSSLHYPPVAPAVVYRETVTGHGWELPEPEEEAGPSTERQRKDHRAESFSSARNLQGLINANPRHSSSTPTKTVAGTSKTNGKFQPSSPTSSVNSSRTNRTNNTITTTVTQPPQPRRLTALASAKAASKLQTTSDPTAYHHSLGYPSTSSETAHLISRFLPPKKTHRPKWEISIEEMYETYHNPPQPQTDDQGNLQPPRMRIGISKGGYRDAHEALIRSMKEIGGFTEAKNRTMRRGISRGYSMLSSNDSGESITGSGGSGAAGEDGGMVLGRSGSQVVRRVGWDGKTPFELSVERCLAQRPKALMGI